MRKIGSEPVDDVDTLNRTDRRKADSHKDNESRFAGANKSKPGKVLLTTFPGSFLFLSFSAVVASTMVYAMRCPKRIVQSVTTF